MTSAPPSTVGRLARPGLLVAAAAATIVVVVLAVTEAGDQSLSIAEALLLGLVEGITEYLPISSTGHLTVTLELLGLTDTPDAEAAADAYAIAIQGGAIVAVLGLYRQRIAGMADVVLRPRRAEPGGRAVLAGLIAAVLPAAVVGFLLVDVIKDQLYGLWPTIGAWFVGGIAILVWVRLGGEGERDLEQLTVRDGLIIGVAQVIALWPGVSRSLVTIVASMMLGLTTRAAVEFSFLLGLVTLTGATLYEATSSGDLILAEFGLAAPLVGFVAAFVSAAAAVVWLVTYLERHSLAIFGWYRIALAVVVSVVVLTTGV